MITEIKNPDRCGKNKLATSGFLTKDIQVSLCKSELPKTTKKNQLIKEGV